MPVAWNKRLRNGGLLAVLSLSLLPSGCATTPSSGPIRETVFDAPSQYLVAAEARGRPLKLKVDPGAPFFVLL